jgi:hypothetical protein
MTLVHPFDLVSCLLVPLAVAAALAPWRRGPVTLAVVLALAGGETLLVLDNAAAFNDYKAIYAPLHVPDSRTLAQIRSPRGLYMLLDDFTERVDTDVSNNAGMLGLSGPPQTYGLYRDGNRLAALPRAGPLDVGYAGATLAALPYTLNPHPRVLLAGSSGGFRIAEAQAVGAASVDVLEPEPVLRGALREGLGPSPAFPVSSVLRISGESPVATVGRSGAYDLIDISSDFLDAAEANNTAFAAEALASYLRALTPRGIVSIPVSIREFPAYAIRMLATARAGLLLAGENDPQSHVLIYRSAWNARVLLFKAPLGAAQVAISKQFCDERSFDVSFYPGMDVAAARANIYNDLPAVSFEEGEVASGPGAHDAIADEARQVLDGEPTASSRAFNLSPITYDRPAYYAVLKLNHLGTIFKRLEILPQAEIGPLVNLAVLAQAAVIALIVLAVPLVAGSRVRLERATVLRAALYFAALGLGFLFIEMFLIERASFYLNDRTRGFAIVLTGMLIFSGLGSMTAHRYAADPRRGMAIAAAVIVVWCTALLAGLQGFMLATLDLPWAIRAAIIVGLTAPASIALGLPFPLGLTASSPARGKGRGFLPWAWGLNGAFSVVATPLANLIALQDGYDRVLLTAMLLYVVSLIAFPSLRKSHQWQNMSAT